jgi:hypothetical protein
MGIGAGTWYCNLGRKQCGLKLGELGAVTGGLDYAAASAAVKRFEQRLFRVPALAGRLREAEAVLNGERQNVECCPTTPIVAQRPQSLPNDPNRCPIVAHQSLPNRCPPIVAQSLPSATPIVAF